MESGNRTREYLTVARNTSNIVDTLVAQVDLRQLAQKLHEAGLVTQHVVEKASHSAELPRNRVGDVMSAVRSQINLDSSKYHSFIHVLKDACPLLAKKLEHYFGKHNFSLLHCELTFSYPCKCM